ncbi:MAG: copper ion binding protein, partial [Brachymonas sp.]|nr:copper ion binding protein [Brachymonas sp.]
MNTQQAPKTTAHQLPIEGMTCASCVGRVEKALHKVPGVQTVSVNLATEQAQVASDGAVPFQQLVEAVQKAGYGVKTATIELQIGGMTCASCVNRVEKALQKTPGVLSASVNLATEKATVQALDTVSFASLAAVVKKAGYEATPVAQAGQATEAKGWPEWWPVAVGGVLTAPLVLPMLLAPFGIHAMP